MIGFEVGNLNLDEALKRLEPLKELAVLPMDETGEVIEDDSVAHESAREIRLLMQKILELDVPAFLTEMRRLFFHLFAADHDHYRDLLSQAARRDPASTKAFLTEMLASRDVAFIDDQYTLHHLIDVMERQTLSAFSLEQIAALKNILRQPFLRLPSVHARLISFLTPVLTTDDMTFIRPLFEMDWIPRDELTWTKFVAALPPAIRAGQSTPFVNLPFYENKVTLEDFENMRWMVGLEAPPTALRFRLLGSLIAEGPLAGDRFFEASEVQPDTAFHREHFETEGEFKMFLAALDRLRADIVREAHHSRAWFENPEPDRVWPWHVPRATAWPSALRELPMNWVEFANPTDDSEFAALHGAKLEELDGLAEKIAELLGRNPLPTTDNIQNAQDLAKIFLNVWERMLPSILQRLDIVP